jgi:hypothetical protein
LVDGEAASSSPIMATMRTLEADFGGLARETDVAALSLATAPPTE